MAERGAESACAGILKIWSRKYFESYSYGISGLFRPSVWGLAPR